MSKNRHLSPFDYLDILQEEYICNDIRTKIYVRRADKDHFRRVLENKKNKIQSIADKNSLLTIFDNKDQYNRYWHRIVPAWGLPYFIYNESKKTQEDKFPYKGTLVKYMIEDQREYGFTIEVDFPNEKVLTTPVNEQEQVRRIHYQDVERLSVEETDQFFYYFTGNAFKLDIDDSVVIAVIVDADFDKKEAHFIVDGEKKTFTFENISRIL